MFELKNPDWTKTPTEREKLRKNLKDWKLWWNVEHQYPYQNRMKPIRRRWLNPFYCRFFKEIFVVNQISLFPSGD